MPSPLLNLMKYGGKPINRQAERFLTHKGRKKRRSKREREAAKRVCPICGKRKIGLEAHMAATHGSANPISPVTVPANV